MEFDRRRVDHSIPIAWHRWQLCSIPRIDLMERRVEFDAIAFLLVCAAKRTSERGLDGVHFRVVVAAARRRRRAVH